jgi:hypothetical protein
LVVRFGCVELGGGYDFGCNWFVETLLGFGFAGFSLLPLCFVEVEDSGAEAILIFGGRVMLVPEFIQELFVADDVRVKVDLDRFGVVADIVVGGVGTRAASVANLSMDDAVEFSKFIFRLPEVAEGKESGLSCLGHILHCSKGRAGAALRLAWYTPDITS